MCVNYFPAADGPVYEQLGLTFDGSYEADSWPAKSAPIIVMSPNTGKPTVVTALYGLLPRFAKDLTFCRNTYNARSETVATKPSFKEAWAKGRFCLVPTKAFVEPYYEPIADDDHVSVVGLQLQDLEHPLAPPKRFKKPVKWAIGMADGSDFAIGGLWSWWKDPLTGEGTASFTMLTLNADQHPFMNRFHRPGDEKRMPFIVRPELYETWLTATPELARQMIEPFPAELMGGKPKSAHPATLADQA